MSRGETVGCRRDTSAMGAGCSGSNDDLYIWTKASYLGSRGALAV